MSRGTLFVVDFGDGQRSDPVSHVETLLQIVDASRSNGQTAHIMRMSRPEVGYLRVDDDYEAWLRRVVDYAKHPDHLLRDLKAHGYRQ